MQRYVASLKKELTLRALTPGEHTRLVNDVERVTGDDKAKRNLALALGLLTLGIVKPAMTPEKALDFWRDDPQEAQAIAEWIAVVTEASTRAQLRAG